MTVAQPERRPNHSVRFYDSVWSEASRRGAAQGLEASGFINRATEAALGLMRCWTCHEVVPLKFGNLAGRPLDEWLAEAHQIVVGQGHKDHQPVSVGSEAVS